MRKVDSEPIINNAPGVRVLRALRQWLSGDSVLPGDRLPTEQTLAERFEVSRTAVRAAFRKLEEEGLISFSGRQKLVAVRAGGRVTNLLTDTVVVLPTGPIGAPPEPRNSSGWSVYAEVGAIQALRAGGMSAFTMDQKVCLNTGALDHLIRERPKGVVLIGGGLDALKICEAFKRAKFPVVAYAEDVDLPGVDLVQSDHASGTYALMENLVSRGCRRILRVWKYQWSSDFRPGWLARRDEGYVRACEVFGVPCLPAVETHTLPEATEMPPDLFREHAIRVLAGYLIPHLSSGEPVDGILATSDGQVSILAEACKLLGKQPGREVLIAGYDNYWSDVADKDPQEGPVATVDKRNLEIGHSLVDLLKQRWNAGPEALPMIHRIEPRLVVLNKSLRLQPSSI